MADKKKTIFHQLSDYFGPESPRRTTYSIDNREILKTTSKEEYDKSKLQSQQNLFLKHQWHKVDNELYQQAVFYETTRIASYTDFEAMEFYPEISAALDILMEESTTPNEDNKVLNIYSDSKRVKKILEDLFYNRLDIHTNLPMWTRNLCKYGDNFLFLNIDDKEGIITPKQLPNIELERHEGDIYHILSSKGMTDEEKKKLGKVSFLWKSKEYKFNPWQIAHFRLLGDDRRLPYGTSLLEKARRIWKQLLLSEDAMLIYRVTRAPERRIFKIFVGNIDDQDVEPYVNQIANRFKRTPLVDPKTGQIDLRYNQMAQDQDFFIPVRDANAPSPIETLPGASNLSEIADIEYLQKKLFTALRIPKTFLGFEEATGEGKNLALQDIRFSRTINRIQQALIQELNKIAIIHLFILGFEDELDNFKLSLNNPSTQADMLKVEHLQQKIQLYRDAVSDAGNGFGAMSMTKAKKDILHLSDDDIKLDLEQQRLEKAASAELENTSSIIKKTGIFDKIDNIYGEIGAKPTTDEAEEGFAAADMGGGGFGGIGTIPDVGEEGLEGEEMETGEMEAPEEFEGEEAPEGELAGESINDNTENLLVEQKMLLEDKKKKYNNIYYKRLLESLERTDNVQVINDNKIEKKTDESNHGINNMIDDINNLID